jgi:hypothetical protein
VTANPASRRFEIAPTPKFYTGFRPLSQNCSGRAIA